MIVTEPLNKIFLLFVDTYLETSFRILTNKNNTCPDFNKSTQEI